jgi:hypothetical protein
MTGARPLRAAKSCLCMAARAKSTSICTQIGRIQCSPICAGRELRRALFGHTHPPYQKQVGYRLSVNTGSVGKPKDGDPRARYVQADLDHRRTGNYVESRTTWPPPHKLCVKRDYPVALPTYPKRVAGKPPAVMWVQSDGTVAPGGGRVRGDGCDPAGELRSDRGASQTGALGHLGNALAPGLAVMVMIAVAGNPREHAQTTSTMQWSVRTRARFLK